MKYIYVVLILGVLCCSEGYGEEYKCICKTCQCGTGAGNYVTYNCDNKCNYLERMGTDTPTTEPENLLHFIKKHELQITELKAEVEELRKMVEKLNPALTIYNLKFDDLENVVGHGPRCYCNTSYEYRLQNPGKPKCHYWPNEQEEHCVILSKDVELLKAEEWYCIDGIWYHETKYKEIKYWSSEEYDQWCINSYASCTKTLKEFKERNPYNLVRNRR